MTKNNSQNSDNNKPIGYDHPLVDEDELDDSPVDDKYRGKWKHIKDDPKAIERFYKTYKNVPKEHREEAMEKIENTDLGRSTDFLVISKSEWRVDDEVVRAYAIAILDSFADRIQQKARWIKSNVNREQSLPIKPYPGELGHTIFQMHVSTVSFVESSCIEILRYNIINNKLPDKESLLVWGSHENRANIDRTKLDAESQENEIFSWVEKSGVHALSRSLLQGGVIDNSMYNKIHTVREIRNDIVHRPEALIFKHFSDGKSILNRAEDIIHISEKFEKELKYIPKHQVYNTLVE